MPVIGKDVARKEPDKIGEKVNIAVKMGDAVFVAQESDGYITPLPGFFIRSSNGFIVSELTIVKGQKITKDDKGNPIEQPAIFPMIFYNNNGNRSYCSVEDSINFDEKTISFRNIKIKFEEVPHTLMSLNTAKRFLNSEDVEIKTIFPLLQAKQKTFVSFYWDERLYDLIACITIATYFFDVFGVFPITWFFGSVDTGKTRGIKTITWAGKKGIVWEDPTKAGILRLAEFLQPTLAIDEYQDVEPFLRGYVRGSYKDGIRSPRVEETKDGFVLRTFGKFHPIIAGSTEDIEYASFTRTIPIKMQKMRQGDSLKDLDPTAYDFDEVRDLLYICRLTQANRVYETFQKLDRNELKLYGREWEIWRAPLTIAKMVNETVFNNLLSLAREICSSKREEMYIEEKDVLTAVYFLLRENKSPSTLTFFPKEITTKIWQKKSKEFTADTWENDIEFKKKYSPNKIGYILNRMNIKGKYVSSGTQRTITIEQYNRLALDFGLVSKEK
jgi:hypothetical protein